MNPSTEMSYSEDAVRRRTGPLSDADDVSCHNLFLAGILWTFRHWLAVTVMISFRGPPQAAPLKKFGRREVPGMGS